MHARDQLKQPIFVKMNIPFYNLVESCMRIYRKFIPLLSFKIDPLLKVY